jgi:hypothetical protein
MHVCYTHLDCLKFPLEFLVLVHVKFQMITMLLFFSLDLHLIVCPWQLNEGKDKPQNINMLKNYSTKM